MAGLLFLVLTLLSATEPFSLLFALILHEGAHITAAALLGFRLPAFNLTAAGMRLSYCNTKGLFQNLSVLLAGCLAGALAALLPFLPAHFRLYSAGLTILNLLPISCLDGGEILLLLLEAFMLPDRAHRAATAVSTATVLVLWMISLAVQLKAGVNLSLLAASLYLTVTTLTNKNNSPKKER